MYVCGGSHGTQLNKYFVNHEIQKTITKVPIYMQSRWKQDSSSSPALCVCPPANNCTLLSCGFLDWMWQQSMQLTALPHHFQGRVPRTALEIQPEF